MITNSLAMRRLRQIMMVVFAAGISVACGASRPVKYYTLDVTPQPAEAAAPQFPIALLVARVASTHLYRDDRVVYSVSAEQLGTYEYERWSEPPVDMIQDSLIEALRSTKQYQSVEPVASNLRGNYLVRTRLGALDEIDKPQLAARFSIELELYDAKSGATVWSDSYTHDEPVAGKKVPDVIAALDQNVKAGTSKLATDLGQYFASQPAK
jgi:ABC-type uncharacterized transport system auxiliary subunit